MSAYTLLRRNLLYTAITLAKRLVVLVGSRNVLAIAVRTAGTGRRHQRNVRRANNRHRRTSPACAHLGTPQTPGHTFEPCSNQRPAEMRTRRVHALNGQRSQLRSRRQAPQAADLQQEHRDSQSRMIDHGQAVSIPSGTPRFA
jgi:hypothetical protein